MGQEHKQEEGEENIFCNKVIEYLKSRSAAELAIFNTEPSSP